MPVFFEKIAHLGSASLSTLRPGRIAECPNLEYSGQILTLERPPHWVISISAALGPARSSVDSAVPPIRARKRAS